MTSPAHPAPLLTRSGREPAIVALAGDWHANTDYAVEAIRHARDGGADAIVHVGDFGYRFEQPFLDALDRALGDLELFFVDGNHEDFDWLLHRPLDDRGVRPVSSRIAHLPRGFRWMWSNRTWLALGGAHSVDRQWREPGEGWWEQETLSDDDVARAVAPGAADVLVCHDVPAGVPSTPAYAPGTFPADDEAASEAHRDHLRRVVERTWPRFVVHGHFHRHYASTLGPARILGLAHDKHDPAFNLAWIDPATLDLVPPTAPAPEIPNEA